MQLEARIDRKNDLLELLEAIGAQRKVFVEHARMHRYHQYTFHLGPVELRVLSETDARKELQKHRKLVLVEEKTPTVEVKKPGKKKIGKKPAVHNLAEMDISEIIGVLAKSLGETHAEIEKLIFNYKQKEKIASWQEAAIEYAKKKLNNNI